ncbi:unnamed protein product, partial [Porites evermanni]
SNLTETAPETEHTSLAAANSNTANLMTVDVNALTSSISLAVTEAVQGAFEKIPQTQPTGVEAVVDEEVSLLTERRYCAGCRFDHVCFKCGTKHPASRCSATQQHRLPFSKEGPVATNSTQQSGHSRKGGQA